MLACHEKARANHEQNVLYLMIVNMPTDEELAEAMAEIEARRSKGFSLPGVLGRL